jgi:hypothetical protein
VAEWSEERASLITATTLDCARTASVGDIFGAVQGRAMVLRNKKFTFRFQLSNRSVLIGSAITAILGIAHPGFHLVSFKQQVYGSDESGILC